MFSSSWNDRRSTQDIELKWVDDISCVSPPDSQLSLQDCDYPAVISYSASRLLFNRELSREERSVRGNLVIGLSKSDIELLDIFEGNVSLHDDRLCHADVAA